MIAIWAKQDKILEEHVFRCELQFAYALKIDAVFQAHAAGMLKPCTIDRVQ